ncbi:MAG TPA: pitrilysin family protein [Patescibacteria group bacterium]|nr:pitrilysin family protein [Patescibacteria group bacterium]
MKFFEKDLKNGLKVVVIPVNEVESVTTMIMVGAGSRYEEKENNGISHFLEHMAFKGTKKRPSAIEIASLVDGAGAESNAFTGKEYTGYYIKSAAHRLELSIDILSDMLQNLLLDPEEIEKEKGVITEELNLYEDTPTRKIGDIYEALLYDDTPMGWDIGGRKEVIKGVKREDFVSYMKKLYSASNMVIVVAGKADVEETYKLVEKYLGEHPTFTTEGYKSVIEGQKEPAFKLHYKKTDQTHFALGVRTVGITDEKDKYPLSLLAAILGSGMSSRLFHEVREKRGLAYYVRTSSENYLDCGHLTTYVGADPKRINDAITVVRDEYKKVMNDGEITEEELVKAKEYTKGHFVLDLEDTRSVAIFYGSDWTLEKKLENPEEITKRIEAVTLADIQRVAKKYLSQPLNLAVIGDFKEEEPFKKLIS